MCKELEGSTLKDAAVLEQLAQVVPVKVDVDSTEGRRLAADYGVRGVPTVVFTDKDGMIVHGFSGGPDVKTFLEQLETAKSKASS